MEVSFVLRDILLEKGAIILMTREGDYELANPSTSMRKRSDLSKRVSLINKSMCDMYLSIHLNSYKSSKWKGAQVFYSDSNVMNETLAISIQESLVENTHTKREAKRIKNIYLNDNANRPGVIIEVAFITNPDDRCLIRQEKYQTKISNAILNGIINYYRDM